MARAPTMRIFSSIDFSKLGGRLILAPAGLAPIPPSDEPSAGDQCLELPLELCELAAVTPEPAAELAAVTPDPAADLVERALEPFALLRDEFLQALLHLFELQNLPLEPLLV